MSEKSSDDELIEIGDSDSSCDDVKDEPPDTAHYASTAENGDAVLNKLEPADMEAGKSVCFSDATAVKQELNIDVTVLQPPDVHYKLRPSRPETPTETKLLADSALQQHDAHGARSFETARRGRVAADSRKDCNNLNALKRDLLADIMGDGKASEIEELLPVKDELVVSEAPNVDNIMEVTTVIAGDEPGSTSGQCALLNVGCCTTDFLLKQPFSTLSPAQKKEIVSRGRSKPEITKEHKRKDGSSEHVHTSLYDKYDWVSGSCKLNKLFCFPCLLFSKSESTIWCKTGFSDIDNLQYSSIKHTHTERHLQNCMSLLDFEQVRIRRHPLENTQHNLKVEQNRNVMKRLINTVVFLGKQGLPFHGNTETKDLTDRGNFVESLIYLGEFDSVINSHIESCSKPRPVFSGLSDDIQNDLISCVATRIRDEIKREVGTSKFVSVMIDQTPDDCHKEQVMVVFRYVVGTRICERFVGFSESLRNTWTLIERILSQLESYGCSRDKLVGQSYDGGSIILDDMNGVQKKIYEQCPSAFFVPCHAHNLNRVLAKSTENSSECKSFFSNVNAIVTFFNKSHKRMSLLTSIAQKRRPEVRETRWRDNSRIVITIHEDKAVILNAFLEILENNTDWDRESVFMAEILMNKMQDFKFCFLLRVFSEIFLTTDALFKVIQSPDVNVAYATRQINSFKRWLVNGLSQKFSNVNLDQPQCEEPPNKRKCTLDKDPSYKCLIAEIVYNITTHINVRYGSFHKFGFLELLHKSNFSRFHNTFPESQVTSLNEHYKKIFEQSTLKNELKALYANFSLRDHTLTQLFHYFSQPALLNVFTEINKLCCLVMTLPCTSLPAECSIPALERIHTYLRNTEAQERHSDLALMAIERELLLKLKRQSNFYDLVLTQYLKKNKKIALEYK